MHSYVKSNGNVRVVDRAPKQRNLGQLVDRTHLPANQQTGIPRSLKRLERAMRISAGLRPAHYPLRDKRGNVKHDPALHQLRHMHTPPVGHRLLAAAAAKAMDLFKLKKTGLITDVDLGRVAAE